MFGEDTHSRSVVVSSAATAREVCHILVESTHCMDEENWALLEQHPSLGLGKTSHRSPIPPQCITDFGAQAPMFLMTPCPRLPFKERCLEDHEVVSQVQASWPQDGDTKLLFRKNYAKYEFFKKPAVRATVLLVTAYSLLCTVTLLLLFPIPQQYFPENMISDCTDVKTGMTPSQLVQVREIHAT